MDACARLAELVHEVDGYPIHLPRDLRAFLASPDAHGAWVADVDGEPVGHVALHPSASPEVMALAREATGVSDAGLGVVARLLVAPTARQRGLGRALLDTAAGAAQSLGLRPILDVVTDYRAAIGLYESAGWTRAGEVRVRLSNGATIDELVFVAPGAATLGP